MSHERLHIEDKSQMNYTVNFTFTKEIRKCRHCIELKMQWYKSSVYKNVRGKEVKYNN